MTDNEKYAILAQAIDMYGHDAQINMAIEEMSELIKALLKWRRYYQPRDRDFYVPLDNIEADLLNNIHEEMSDVLITIEQLKQMFGYNAQYEVVKLNRLRERIEHDPGFERGYQ